MMDGSSLITCVHGKSKQKVQFMVRENPSITLYLLVLPRPVFKFIFALCKLHSKVLIQSYELKAFYRIQVIRFVVGKDKVGILLILFNAVMKIIVTSQSDHMMLASNILIDSVQDGQRLLIRPWIHVR